MAKNKEFVCDACDRVKLTVSLHYKSFRLSVLKIYFMSCLKTEPNDSLFIIKYRIILDKCRNVQTYICFTYQICMPSLISLIINKWLYISLFNSENIWIIIQLRKFCNHISKRGSLYWPIVSKLWIFPGLHYNSLKNYSQKRGIGL